MEAIYNGAPMHISKGFDVVKQPTVAPESPATPIHYPFIFGFAERGELKPQKVTNNINALFGNGTTNTRSKFFTHQNTLATLLSNNANQYYFKRLVSSNARQGVSVMYCGISRTEVSDTLTDDIVREGDAVGQVSGSTVSRKLVMWKRKSLDISGKTVSEALAELKNKALVESVQVGGVPVEFDFYAVFADVRSHGSWGSLAGYTIETPDVNSATPLDTKAALATGGRLHNISFWERASATTSPAVKPTLQNQQSAKFCLKPDAFDETYKADMTFPTMLGKSYTQFDPNKPNYPTYAPYSEFIYYEGNYATIVSKLQSLENTIFDDGLGEYFISPFTCRDMYGSDYYKFRLVATSELTDIENHRWGALNVVYTKDGADGDTSDVKFDELVASYVGNFGNEYNLLSRELYPYSVFYDTGFTSDTKAVFSDLTRLRRDVAIGWGTHIHGEASIPDPLQEQSIARFIKAQAELVPESTYFGTAFCRGWLMVGSGMYTPADVPFRVSSVLHSADLLSRYAGSGQGILKPGADFSTYPGNRVEVLNELSNIYRSDEQRVEEWDLGMNSIIPYDEISFHTPGLYTLYGDDTSPIKSVINMFIAICAEKASRKVWHKFAGVDNLPKSVLRDEITKDVRNEMENRFDGRISQMVVRTYFTEEDIARGFSWSTKITLKLAMPHGVGVFDVQVDRLEEDIQAETY